jgi:hypothetical protein
MHSPLDKDKKAVDYDIRNFLLKALIFVFLMICTDQIISMVCRRGLDDYYTLAQPAKILCVGHSQTVLGIDKVRIEREMGLTVAKFALEGANTSDRLALIRYYLARQPDSVKAVVYDVSAYTFTGEGLSSNSYRLLFPFMENAEVREFVHKNCQSWSEYWLRILFRTPRYNESSLALATRGYLKYWGNLKMGTIDIEMLKNDLQHGRFRRIQFDKANIQVFEDTIAFVRKHGIPLVLVFMPTVDLLNQAEPEEYRLAVEKLGGYSARDKGVIFLDYNPYYEHQYSLFYDPIHLNADGQRVVTERLIADLRRIINTNF